MSTHAVVINFARPDNMAAVIAGLCGQTVPIDLITVVDHQQKELLSQYVNEPGQKFIQWRLPDDGIGPCSRFLPALAYQQYDYTLFVDDDLVIGNRAHEHLLTTANKLGNSFATLGEIGRVYSIKSNKFCYRVQDVPRVDSTVSADLTCRAHFVCTRNLPFVIIYIQCIRRLIAELKITAPINWERHDDILLCEGLQLYTGYGSVLTPTGAAETKIRFQDLPDNFALSRCSDHLQSREWLVNFCRTHVMRLWDMAGPNDLFT
jgi:hypothetical protein